MTGRVGVFSALACASALNQGDCRAIARNDALNGRFLSLSLRLSLKTKDCFVPPYVVNDSYRYRNDAWGGHFLSFSRVKVPQMNDFRHCERRQERGSPSLCYSFFLCVR